MNNEESKGLLSCKRSNSSDHTSPQQTPDLEFSDPTYATHNGGAV